LSKYRYRKPFDPITQSLPQRIEADTPTFLGIPYATTRYELEAYGAAILGIPYGAPPTVGRPMVLGGGQGGGGRGILEIRANSLKYGGYLPELEIDVFEGLKPVDYGNVDIVDDLSQSMRNVERKVCEVLRSGLWLITLGESSPCSSYSVVKATASLTKGKIGVISLDAHGDNEDEYLGEKTPGPATWEARMWEIGNVDPKHHLEIGLRGSRNTREMAERYEKQGSKMYTSFDVQEMGVQRIVAEAYPHVFEGVDATWMHLDLDVLDIGVAPDYGDEPFGLGAWQVLKFVTEACRRGVKVLSILGIPPGSVRLHWIVTQIVLHAMAGRISALTK